MGIITMCGFSGSFAKEIGRRLADELGLIWLDQEAVFERFLSDKLSGGALHMLSQSPKFFQSQSVSGICVQDYLTQALREWGAEQNFLLYNFAGAQFLKSEEHALHVKIIAPHAVRVARCAAAAHLSESSAEKAIDVIDRKYQRFLNSLFGSDCEAECYDVLLSSEHSTINGMVHSIVALYDDLLAMMVLRSSQTENGAQMTMANIPVMKNDSEIEFARVLDRYQVDWRYEPKTFPIEWDEEGHVTLAFSPDFYLPRFNLYLELTTMNQKYVTMKNRKARRLRELYPGINVRIVYQKDFLALMERFEEPLDEDAPSASASEKAANAATSEKTSNTSAPESKSPFFNKFF